MTDHKATVKIEFTIYGVTKKMDSWINWDANGSALPPIDQRVINFFTSAYDAAREVYDDENDQSERERLERLERAELERLKAKYENKGSPDCASEGK